MKLALCLFKYFPYGGLQRDFLEVALELIRRGHEVTVYTRSWDGDMPDGLTVQLLNAPGLTNYGKNKRFYERLSRVLEQRRANGTGVDLVVGFNKIPGLDVYFCADTCFATKAYEHKGWLYRLAPRTKWSLKYERAVCGTSSKTQILLLSATEGKAFQKYYATPQERMHLMPPGINKSRVRTSESGAIGAATRKQLGIAEHEKVVAFLGSDYKRKGLDRLLRALASLPEDEKSMTKLLVIGCDKRMAEYQHQAEQLNVTNNVIFAGQRDDVPALLFASDYYAHPAYLENTGNAILEAVVAGLPVLCTAVCGFAFYIEDYKLGAVVPEPFDQSVMNAMFRQLINAGEQERLRCIEFAKTEDIYSCTQRIVETIESVGKKRCP